MTNKKIDLSLQQAKKCVAEFVRERDWNQFHTPKDLAMAVSIEANELLELFLWKKQSLAFNDFDEQTKENISDEMADVFHALCAFANVCNLDLSKAFEKKLEKTKKKYPVARVKGKADKYTTYLKNE